MLAKLVLKNVLYSSSSSLVASLTGLITVIFLARALKPELFGLYSLSLSTVAILSIFTDLGIRTAATRYIADAVNLRNYRIAGGYTQFLLNLKIILTSLVVLILVFSSENLALFFDKPISTPLKLLGIYLAFSSISSLLLGMANAMNDFKADLLNHVVAGFSKLFLTVIFVSLGFSLLGAVFAVVLSGTLAFIILSYYIIRKYRFLFSRGEKIEQKRIIKFIMLTALVSIPIVIFANIDIVMIGYFLKAEDVGYYRAGFSVVSAIISLISIPAVLLPIFVKLEGEDLNKAFLRSFRYSSILCIPSAFGLMLISENLLIFAYGVEYLPGLLAMQILCILLISPLFAIYGSIFVGKERPELNFYPILLSLLINISLNYLMIPIFGIVGAALATIISNIFFWLMLAYICFRVFGIHPKVGEVVRPLFCAIIMFSVARNFDSMTLIIPIAILIYLTMLYIIKGIKRDDLEFIKKIWKG